MKIKGIIIKFSDGKRFLVPSKFIAEERAKYYAKVDDYSIDSIEYNMMIQSTLDSSYEIEDWIANNMDWSDVKDHAIDLGGNKETNYEKEFLEQDIEEAEIELD